MQLNVYVPKEREAVIRALDEMARTSGKSKNQLVLDAIDHYLGDVATGEPHPKLRTYRLGVIEPWSRESLYEERFDSFYPPGVLRVAESPAEYDAQD
ncbi:MAG TPA: ribbon-helix-helix domain-containing protein [Chloroflexota bacterium]|nr:ribbon-helix-helix domain-containing protein [Chloroflexota bacterium]